MSTALDRHLRETLSLYHLFPSREPLVFGPTIVTSRPETTRLGARTRQSYEN